MSIESVMPSNHLIFCCPLLLWSSTFPSLKVISNESVFLICGQSIRVSALASVLPMSYSGLISFRIDLFDLLAVQGTLRSLLQHHSSKASILQRSAFFMIQLSLPYITTGKKTTMASLNLLTNLDSILKSRDISLSTEFCIVRAMVFLIVMYSFDSWTIKKVEH